MSIDLIKAHAYGNDFLFAPLDQTPPDGRARLAREMCDRHTGVGGDGLVLHTPILSGSRMVLYNADGGVAEVSGNAVRCLAAIVARDRPELDELRVETDAGPIALRKLETREPRWIFEAEMPAPSGLARRTLEVAGAAVEVVQLSVGNPQCVVLGGPLTEDRLHELGAALAVHEAYPHGTNVELVEVVTPSHIRILIWERGVGPTAASGTGACASGVAAAAFGGASRSLDVESPGGVQRVVWEEAAIRLTGWAEIVMTGRWDG